MDTLQPISYWSVWMTIVVAMATVYTSVAKTIDLSHPHGPHTIMSPRNPQYKLDVNFEGDIVTGVFAKSNTYSVGEHGGTHMDAPSHFARDGLNLDQIPLENTIADGVMIDCSEEVIKDTNYALSVQKIKDWEKENGQIPQGAAVIINFHWSHRFNDSTLYFNSQDLDHPDTYRFPIVSEDAIQWLINQRDISMLGHDTASADLWESTFPVHVEMLSRNKLLVENLKDPGRLPATGFRFYASPIKFEGGTGGQVRAFALTGTHTNGGQTTRLSHYALVSLGVLAPILIYCRL